DKKPKVRRGNLISQRAPTRHEWCRDPNRQEETLQAMAGDGSVPIWVGRDPAMAGRGPRPRTAGGIVANHGLAGLRWAAATAAEPGAKSGARVPYRRLWGK